MYTVFLGYGYIKKHVMIHSGEKSYKCKLCQEVFISSGDLKKHIRFTVEKILISVTIVPWLF